MRENYFSLAPVDPLFGFCQASFSLKTKESEKGIPASVDYRSKKKSALSSTHELQNLIYKPLPTPQDGGPVTSLYNAYINSN